VNRLATLGTSDWVDGLVPPAELERLVREDSVTGLTSNPTIFRAAVLGGEGYAARIAARDGTPQSLYEALRAWCGQHHATAHADRLSRPRPRRRHAHRDGAQRTRS
jgi:transaldolase/glucose-6-phosphate isomerase